MIIGPPHWSGEKVTTSIESPIGEFKLYFRVPQAVSPFPADSFFIASLLWAMRKDSRLKSMDSVSPRLLGAVPKIQTTFVEWNQIGWGGSYKKRHLQQVEIDVSARDGAGAKAGGAASFFTAGIDSFYTALKHADEIQALIYVHGYDVMLKDRYALENAAEMVRRAAAGLGKPLIEVKTNLHDVSRNFISWGPMHGAALASVAPLFAGRFARIYIPASVTYDFPAPWGSHPELDPLWSTDEVEIVHDGAEATRQEKTSAIAGNQAVTAALRVCLESPLDRTNCGACEKCLRTMVMLRALNRLESFSTFPPLDLSNMAFAFKPRMPPEVWGRIWRRVLAELEARNKDPELQEAIKHVLQTGGVT